MIESQPSPWRTAAAAFALAAVYFTVLQAADPRLADYDSYFHIRYAQLLSQRGPWMDFPWMPHSVFDGGFVDHQWLYHVILVPFTWLSDLRVAAKASAVVLSSAAVSAFAAVLHRQRVRWPVLWAVVLLAGSRFLVVRLMMPRTQALSLLFLLLGWAAAINGNTRRLGIFGFLYGWTYHVSAMLLPTALSTVLPPGRPSLQRCAALVGIAALAVAAGLLLTPYFPHSASFFWLHVVEKVGNTRGLEVGAEWYPIHTRLFLQHTAPAIVVGLVAVGGALLQGTRASRDTLSALILALGWTAMALWSQKWIEVAVPFGLLAAALLWRDVGLSARWLLPMPVLAIVNGVQAVDHIKTTVPDHDRLAAVGAALEAEPGPVFHPDWTDFSELFFYAPSCHFTVGLDPTFLAAADPSRYDLLDATLKGQVTDLSGAATAAYGARWVVLTDPALAAIAAQDNGLELVIDDGNASAWRVTAWQPTR